MSDAILDPSLASWLENAAPRLDADAAAADEVLPRLAGAHVFAMGVPEARGGAGGRLIDVVEAIAAVSAHSLAAGFVFWGHRTYVDYLLQSPNMVLADRLLPDLLGGRIAGATGLVVHSDLPIHGAVSLKRIFVGLAFALAIGVPTGLAVGTFGALEAATTPAFQFLRMISPLSWMPLAVMVFGVGDQPIYFLLAFAAGVRQLDPRWILLARSLAATRWEMLFRVILPGVMGHILTGVRLAIGILWIVLVPCEMLGVSAGLGSFILDTCDRLAYSELMAMVLLIGVLGYALDTLACVLCRRWS